MTTERKKERLTDAFSKSGDGGPSSVSGGDRLAPGMATYHPEAHQERLSDKPDLLFIPHSVCEQINGKEFPSFAALRQEINRTWARLAKSGQEDCQQWSEENIQRMQQGRNPLADVEDQRGGRRSYEYDHLAEIRDRGPVYHLNNLQLKAPNGHVLKIQRTFNEFFGKRR